MKTSKLLYLISGILMSAFLVFSCKDDFTEEDFLLMQQEMATQDFQNRLQELLYQAQLARSSDSAMTVLQNMLNRELWLFQDSASYERKLNELRNAGLLLSWTIQVQDNRVPVDGATVDILTADIDQGRTLSSATDVNGNVTFTDVTVGRNLISLSKTGYFNANAAVEFTANTIQQTYAAGGNYNFIVIRRQESTILPLFSSTSSETATISGLATIDLDLTNNIREFAPLGTTVRANISDALQDYDLIYPDTYPDDYTGGDAVLSQTQRVINYNIEGGPNVGAGTVDATGNYSLVVPTISEGFCVELIFESFQATVRQAIMFDETTGQPVTPAYVDLNRFFGPADSYSNLQTALVQWVPGAIATFPVPPSQGSGFALDFTVQGRDLGVWTEGTFGNGPDDILTDEDGFSQDDVMYRVSNPGTGYTTAAPVFSVTGGGGTGADLIANMIGLINGINITNGGDYLAADAPTIEIYVVINGDTFQIATIAVPPPALDNDPIATGALDPNTVTVSNGANLNIGGNGFDGTIWPGGTNEFYTTDIDGVPYDATFTQDFTRNITFADNEGRITNILIRVTGSNGVADATATLAASMEIDALTMATGGTGYTSAPAITATGGTTVPVIVVTRFATQYTIAVNNTATSPYVVLPDVEIFLQPFTDVPSSLIWTEDNDVTFDIPNSTQSQTDDVNVKLVIDGTGDIQFYDQTYTYITEQRTVSAPYALVKDVPVSPAWAWVNINDAGVVTGLSIQDYGDGYNSIFGVTIAPTITGAPGTGAAISLLGFGTLSSGEYTWGNSSPYYKVISGGQDYLMNLNFPFDGINDAWYRNDVAYEIFTIDGMDSDLPDPSSDCIKVFPGNSYRVDGYYGSGALPAENTQTGTSQFPGFLLD